MSKVTNNPVDISRSSMVIDSNEIELNSKVKITITLVDNTDNQLLKGGNDVIITSDFDGITISKVKDNKDGTYSADLTANKIGSGKISFSVDNIESLSPIRFTVFEIVADKIQSTIISDKTSLTTSSDAAIIVTLKDEKGNPLPGRDVVFICGIDGITLPKVKDNNDGTYSGLFKPNKAGTLNIGFAVNGEIFPGGTELVVEVVDTKKEIRKTGKVAPGHTIYHDSKKYTEGMEISLPLDAFNSQVLRKTLLS